jgi:hypothetical protein
MNNAKYSYLNSSNKVIDWEKYWRKFVLNDYYLNKVLLMNLND